MSVAFVAAASSSPASSWPNACSIAPRGTLAITLPMTMETKKSNPKATKRELRTRGLARPASREPLRTDVRDEEGREIVDRGWANTVAHIWKDKV